MYFKNHPPKFIPALSLFLLLFYACQEEPVNQEAYRNSIKTWQNERNEGMADTTSWLSLVGLHWLEAGESTFGADSSNTLIFPASAPDFAGSFTLSDSTVRIQVGEEVLITHQGAPIKNMVLLSDMQKETTYLQMGHINFYVIRRPEGIAIRVKDSQNSALLAFDDIPNFSIDPTWKVDARLDWYDTPRPIQIPTVLGSERTQYSPAKLVFELDGDIFELSPYSSYYGDPTWTIIFSDLTNGETTYGGGRFLEIPAPQEGAASMVLDFNKAYNPPCAFSPFATCPLPPPENRLALAIPAGEQMYGELH